MTTWAYFDTSALVKRYVAEPGRPQVLRLLRRHACVTSAVLRIELRSALRRRLSEGSLDADKTAKILERLAADRRYITLVEVGEDVLVAAETLVAHRAVRTLDAIHVAAALVFGARVSGPPLVFVTADKRQADVATAERLTVTLIAS